MLAGAFGAVYKATLDEVDQVAVKMLPSDQLKDGQIKAFLTEVWTDIPLCVTVQSEVMQTLLPMVVGCCSIMHYT